MSNDLFGLSITDLLPFSFIGGTEMELTFGIYDETTGSAIDLGSSDCKWVMSPYGNPSYATLTLNGVVSGSPNSHEFVVIISGSSTSSLSGKFTHQPWVTDPLGNEFRTSQGNLLIIPRNG